MSASTHPLIQHIHNITACRDINGEQVLAYFETQTFRKKALLQEEGKRCPSYFFVVDGCLRLYFTDDSGAEQTLQFALEHWWMTDLDAFRSGRTSAYSIQALSLPRYWCSMRRTIYGCWKKYP